jgi:hypothetical protein
VRGVIDSGIPCPRSGGADFGMWISECGMQKGDADYFFQSEPFRIPKLDCLRRSSV